MKPERSSLVFFAAAAAAVLWTVLIWPNMSFGAGRAADIVHGVIVAAIVWGGFYKAVTIYRRDEEPNQGPGGHGAETTTSPSP